MIISHSHKFIFLKTTKTAGTSTEIALYKFCGPDDIITPISREDEKTKRKRGYPGPQNYFLPISSYSIKDAARLIKGQRKRFYNHITAKEVKAHIGDQMWNSYYKFCIERNPWDRIISLYYFCNRSEPRITISEFIHSNAPLRLKKGGYGIYTIDGRLAVDKICRFENLSKDLEEVRKQVGIHENARITESKVAIQKGQTKLSGYFRGDR